MFCRLLAFCAILLGTVILSVPALAQCTVPNVLTNGQVADASEVMDNFYAVAACSEDLADAAVTPTGTPTVGALAVFASSKTIASADLSGDVTTSGTVVTTLAASGVVPGTYVNATIAVDGKGRITSAADGSGGSGATGLSLIDTQVADGTAASVTFSSLPQVFRDLVVIVTGQSSSGVQELAAYANGDTNTAHYRNFIWNMWGSGSASVPRIGVFPGSNVPNAGTAAQISAEFFNYASSVWKKNAMSEAQYEDASNFFRNFMEWKWQDTSAITQLEFRVTSGNIANGTVFSLYGRGEN